MGGENLKDDTTYLLGWCASTFLRAASRTGLRYHRLPGYLLVCTIHQPPQYASVLDVGNTGAFSAPRLWVQHRARYPPAGSNAECLASTGETSNARVAALKISSLTHVYRAYLGLLSTGTLYINAWLTILTVVRE